MMAHPTVQERKRLRCNDSGHDMLRGRHLAGGPRQPDEPLFHTDTDRYRESSAAQPSWPLQNLSGLRVLVIDDDEGSLDYFATALRTAGASVTTASTARDGLSLAQEHHPDVILTDIAMPDHDGYWLLREVRNHADAALRDVPIVAATAFGRVHSRTTALAAGFTSHLSKPVDPHRLCAAIAEAGRRRSQ